MKKKLILILLIGLIGYNNVNSQTQTLDTLNWLKTNIEQRKNLFIGKKFSVLMDSLYGFKNGIVEYLGPEWYSIGSLNDTIWTQSIGLYFEETIGSVKSELHKNAILNNGIHTLNTHIKVIKVIFLQPIPFLRKWWSNDSANKGSNDWTPIVESLYKDAIIYNLSVEEY